MTASMAFRVHHIHLDRAEGPRDLCGPQLAKDFADADRILANWAPTVSAIASSDAVDFMIIWIDRENGLVLPYMGTYSLRRNERLPLAEHIQLWCDRMEEFALDPTSLVGRRMTPEKMADSRLFRQLVEVELQPAVTP